MAKAIFEDFFFWTQNKVKTALELKYSIFHQATMQ